MRSPREGSYEYMSRMLFDNRTGTIAVVPVRQKVSDKYIHKAMSLGFVVGFLSGVLFMTLGCIVLL